MSEIQHRTKIAEIILSALNDSYKTNRGSNEISALLEIPKESKLGDLAFPCFSLAKELKKAPPLIAADLANILKGKFSDCNEIEKVVATGPYLNFFLNKSSLAATLIPAILNGEFLARRPAKDQRVMVEYSQPNTHKAFHVGHIRCAALGDSIWRFHDWHGYEVIPTNYLGDEGTHVAKCLWYYLKYHKDEKPKNNRGEFLGTLYTKATLILDLATYSKVPLPGIYSCKVIEKKLRPNAKDSWIIKVETPQGIKQAITGGIGFEVGDIIPFALPGAVVNDRQVVVTEKYGLTSEGLVCSEQELGLSQERLTVPVYPKDTPIGKEIIEIYRIPGTLPDNQSILERINQMELEVSKILQAMERKDSEIAAIWSETKEWSMQEFYQIYSWLNCRFDHYYFESQFGESGKKLVREYKEKGIFVEDNGAIGADLRNWDLGFCILIKRDGTAMYATRDLSLAQLKFEQHKIDRSIYVVDAAQTLHFKQVFKCLELMGYAQAQKCQHLAYGQVVLPDGKMSSRKGNVILFSELQSRLLQKINTEYLDKYQGEWSEEEIAKAGHYIALATMRYGMLNQDNNMNIIFDLDAWTAKTGNTGPYMLYAYARIQSIMRELGEYNRDLVNWSELKAESEIELLLHLKEYHTTLDYALKNLSALPICTYVYELAKKFSRMYQNCSILHADNEQQKVTRAELANATALVIKHALNLLGIKTLERM